MEVGILEIDSLTGVMVNPLKNVGFTTDMYPSFKNADLEQRKMNLWPCLLKVRGRPTLNGLTGTEKRRRW